MSLNGDRNLVNFLLRFKVFGGGPIIPENMTHIFCFSKKISDT
jgi:hypothetical protein